MNYRRVKTHNRCKMCRSETPLLCAYDKNGNLNFHCGTCDKKWKEEQSAELKQIPGKVLGVFMGYWLEREMEDVLEWFEYLSNNESSLIKMIGKKEEWSFYKGMNIYSAWRISQNNVSIALDLPSLLEKMEKRCIRKNLEL